MVMIPQYGESHSLEHNTISTNQNELYTFQEVQLLENRIMNTVNRQHKYFLMSFRKF